MKFTCKTSALLQALQMVNRAVSSQQALPILGNILLHAEWKRCIVSATDLELSITTNFEAHIENEGSITIPSKAILNFAQYNNDDEVLLETSEGTQLKCVSRHAKTIIAGESANDYPTITSLKKETSFSLEAVPFLQALHLVTFSSARSTLRPVLSGVYIRNEKGRLILVATDSYRLSEYQLPVSETGPDISCIIPAKVLDEVMNILGGKSTDKNENDEGKVKPKIIEVSLSAQQIGFKIGQTEILSRLIEGKFPDYKQIIPKEEKTTAAFSIKDLTTVAKRMHYFAKEMNNNLTFSIQDGTAHIATPKTQTGRDEAILDVEQTGGINKIALSSAYILDFLGRTGVNVVKLSLTDSMHPAVFTIPDDSHYLHLIMPLRLQEEAPAEKVEKREKVAVAA